MKKCPHCKDNIGFAKFIFSYGSDTIVAKQGNEEYHHHEHICKQCKKKFWIRYQKRTLWKRSERYFPLFIVISIGVIWIGLKFLQLSVLQTISLLAILLFIIYPIFTGYMKYKSADFKPID